MKLSQLIGREEIYGIISKTICTNSFFEKKSDKDKEIFDCYKHLNIISNKSLNSHVKDALVFEYTLSKNILKQFLQGVYVKVIFLPFIRGLFSERRIMLPSHLKNYGVVPGNHRIRLFDPSLKKIIVLLKNDESAKFIKNDIDTRVNNTLSYTPRVLSHGSDWLIEEFVVGVPFNRIKNIKLDKLLKELVSLHSKELVGKNIKCKSIDTYLTECKIGLNSLVEIIEENNPIKKEMFSGIENILSDIESLNITEIETSTTHGDFQEGNIRINSKNELYVLDWESADTRFYLYDIFVLLSRVRTGIGLERAFEIFFEKVDDYNIKIERYSRTSLIVLLCFEELRFHFSEDISYNFFSSGVNSQKTLTKITAFLHSIIRGSK